MNYQVLDFCNEDGSINTLNNENVPQGSPPCKTE